MNNKLDESILRRGLYEIGTNYNNREIAMEES